ncbi:unnamed protein product [Anisakis simplex]|uniref:Adenosine 3'-phospho 5'-phosphosulfate transporter 2 n=1 Tax=Anisakis simplex TaxID=6269 RepID=A0A3P6PQJ4_ANISI|nr:unnamed protein product [Anisakis simplex]
MGYLGVNVVLSLVRTSGALLAVTVTTVRKAITIVVSFVMFAKPFTSAYLWGGSIVMLSIYLNLYNKNRLKWDPMIRKWIDYVTGADRIQRPTFKTTEVL